jgi:urease accessory protein
MSRTKLVRKSHDKSMPQARLVLPFEDRQKSRLLALLDSGEEVGVLLPRGTVLRGGDQLASDDGRTIEVVASAEGVSIVSDPDPRQLLRAAYHLGNRHVPVQVTPTSLRYLHDHVLDEMVQGLGLHVRYANLPFEPESGAYASEHAHQNQHSHEHEHSHHD